MAQYKNASIIIIFIITYEPVNVPATRAVVFSHTSNENILCDIMRSRMLKIHLFQLWLQRRLNVILSAISKHFRYIYQLAIQTCVLLSIDLLPMPILFKYKTLNSQIQYIFHANSTWKIVMFLFSYLFLQ